MSFRRWLEEHPLKLDPQYKATILSAAVHIALLLILASVFMASPEPPSTLLMASMSDTEEMIQEVVLEIEEVEISDLEDVSEELPTETEEIAPETPELSAADFAESIRGDAIAAPAAGNAMASVKIEKPKGKPSRFFGSKNAAVNYVFVIDNSLSMTKGRFETALIELDRAIESLTPKQRFYVLFYSDQAYSMLHPLSVDSLVAATPKNKYALRRWLNSIELCLKTNGKQAIARAYALQPDVIFVLGDGAFTDGADKFFTARAQKSPPLNVRGMEITGKAAISFRKLALANGGDYKDVGVSAEGLMMAKKFPRKRNNKKGLVWGQSLPVDRKAKK